MKYTNAEKAKEATREVAMRKRVYGKHGELNPQDIARIEIMEEIASEYREREQKERLI